ncbi:DMT family transporter [Ciceribacter selenitireducens]
MASTEKRERRPGDYIHLFMIYVVWATGYLAMKIGLTGPNAFEVFQLQSLRLFLGGGILTAIAIATGRFTRPGSREFAICVVSGLLFWIFANGGALFAVRELPSGFVVMAMGTIPLWSALYRGLTSRNGNGSVVALLIGFAGLALILYPTLPLGQQSLHVSGLAMVALVGAPVAWVAATQLQPYLRPRMDPISAAGLQLIIGGALALVLTEIGDQPWPSPPSTTSLLSLLYLAVFASAITFYSYVSATSLFPGDVVSAFAYVNPLVGVFLGWLVLDERPAAISLLGMVLVVASVIVTLRRDQKIPQQTSESLNA